jgi:uncharacterized protein
MSSDKIERALWQTLTKKLLPQKVLIILGARRTGKTDLLKRFLATQNKDSYLLLNGEDQATEDLLMAKSASVYKRLLGKKNLLVIDEAQHLKEIGQKLKLMVDEIKNLKIIVTGSSMLDLSNKLGEPLVGRENTVVLYPISQMEFSKYENLKQTAEKLEERLIYGSYPELEQYPSSDEKSDYLEGLVNSLLLKDIFQFQGIKKSDKITDLLRLVAFQIGREVSIDELANQLKGISRNTVEQYLDLLTKVFILYKVRGYSSNLRKEVTKTSKWYFYDNGIRNAIIRNFNPLNMRSDVGELWESYLMSERQKFNAYKKNRVNSYFWRTYDQQEIDLIEEKAGQLMAFEFKWNTHKKSKVPGGWKSGYPDAPYKVIDRDNYLEFIGG